MNELAKIGSEVAFAGIMISGLAVIIRLVGISHLYGYETLSFFIVGLFLVVLAAAAKLYEVK